MTDFSKFRGAFNGFNRSDVANYIEALCSEHQKQLKAERGERDILLRQIDELHAQLDQAKADRQAVEQELAQARQAQEETQAMLEEALSMEPAQPQEDYHSMELDAYRRAEAMERSTAERAARVKQQLNDLVEQTAGRYETVGEDIRSLSEDLSDSLKRLLESLSELEEVFEQTSDRFDHIDAEETEEA